MTVLVLWTNLLYINYIITYCLCLSKSNRQFEFFKYYPTWDSVPIWSTFFGDEWNRQPAAAVAGWCCLLSPRSYALLIFSSSNHSPLSTISVGYDRLKSCYRFRALILAYYEASGWPRHWFLGTACGPWNFASAPRRSVWCCWRLGGGREWYKWWSNGGWQPSITVDRGEWW